MFPRHFPFLLVVASALHVAALSVAKADIITLVDGTEHEGEVIRDTPESLSVRVRKGGNTGTVVIARSEIASIEKKALPPDPILNAGLPLEKTAREAESDTAKAAEAWARVGDYYSRHTGYGSLARAAYHKALAFNPDHAGARTQLGFIKTPDGWAEKNPPRREEPPAIPEKAVANELTIGPRREDVLIQKLLDEAAARRRAEEELERFRLALQNNSFTSYGYTRDYFYVGPYGGVYYLPDYGYGYYPLTTYCAPVTRSCWPSKNYCSPYTYSTAPVYGGGFHYPFAGSRGGNGCYTFGTSSYGHSGFSNYAGYGNSGYGLGVNFSGRVGSFNVNGSLISGHNTYSSSGFIGGGFRRR
ncbi:MAG TPA: hypothetical protein VEK08_05020 [Planctomycetota bacterium]|nr:hypothetical protein [Planctomycetota bacterium]